MTKSDREFEAVAERLRAMMFTASDEGALQDHNTTREAADAIEELTRQRDNAIANCKTAVEWLIDLGVSPEAFEIAGLSPEKRNIAVRASDVQEEPQ